MADILSTGKEVCSMESDFYDIMRIVCLAVPEGRVASYGQIALLCGAPGHSRQVGYGLKMNLAGKDVPAHRIVNGKGELSGARHFEIEDLQKLLLQQEGVEVEWTGKCWRVDMKRFGWRNTPEKSAEIENKINEMRARE